MSAVALNETVVPLSVLLPSPYVTNCPYSGHWALMWHLIVLGIPRPEVDERYRGKMRQFTPQLKVKPTATAADIAFASFRSSRPLTSLKRVVKDWERVHGPGTTPQDIGNRAQRRGAAKAMAMTVLWM